MIEICLSGSGGQGVITAAIILAEAAVMEGKEAVQSQSYGPEARGGASKAEVIVDNTVIYHPKVLNPQLVLAMTQQAANKYAGDLQPDGILLVDEDLVPDVPACRQVIKLPITRLAVEKLGRDLYANIIALGALVKVSGVVALASIQEAVARRVPAATVEKNMQALQIGFDAVQYDARLKFSSR